MIHGQNDKSSTFNSETGFWNGNYMIRGAIKEPQPPLSLCLTFLCRS